MQYCCINELCKNVEQETLKPKQKKACIISQNDKEPCLRF
jgi:hypothetical protein